MAHALSPALVVLGALALAACAATPVPALRIDDSADGAADLEAAAARLAGASRVALPADAFRAEPVLVLERAAHRTLDGLDDGRRRTAPVILRLERAGGGCRLVDAGSGAGLALDAVRCAAAP